MLFIIYTGLMCFTGCFKPCFLKKQSLCYPTLSVCAWLCVLAISQDFLNLGLPPVCERSTPTNNHTFLKALRNLKQDTRTSLQCGRECEDTSSHTPQRHFVSSTGKNVMGICTLRHGMKRKVCEIITSVSSCRTAVSSML